MKIKINNSFKCGLVSNRDGEICEATKGSDGYRLSPPLSYIRIDNSMIANKYAEVVSDTPPVLTAQQYGALAPIPYTGIHMLECVEMVGGPLAGTQLWLSGISVGQDIGFAMSSGVPRDRYIIIAFNVNTITWTAVLQP